MKRPPSVCVFTNLYPPAFSGSAIHCVDLGRNLAKRDCRITIITSKLTDDNPEFERVDGVDIFRLPSLLLPKLPIALNFPWLNLSFSPSNLRRVIGILQENPPDVIHLHNHMLDTAFLALLSAKQLNIPLILTVHTIIKHTNPIYDIFLHLADRFILKHLVVQRSKAVICQDDIVAGYVKNTFNHANIQLIPYGITPLREPDQKKTELLRKRYNIKGGPIILSLGHLHETRNRRELIEIMPRLLKTLPDLKLLIVGYIGTNSTEKLANRLGVRENIIFTGAVPHEDIPEFLALADIEAHWFGEKHPHKTPGIAGQEVMTAGKVLVSNAPENIFGQGVLKNGENVVLVNPCDLEALFTNILAVLIDKPAKLKMQEFAKITAQTYFSWDAIYKKILEVYKSAQGV